MKKSGLNPNKKKISFGIKSDDRPSPQIQEHDPERDYHNRIDLLIKKVEDALEN